MLIFLIIVIPIALLVVSFLLTIKLAYMGVLIATLLNTVYFCFVLAVLTGMGHPNAVVRKIRWRDHFLTISGVAVASAVVLSLLALLSA